MRDAESALDQLISFCGEKIEEADVLSMFGLTAQGQLLDLARAMLAGEIEGVLRQLNDLANRGKDLGRLLSDLLNHFRNLLIFQVSGGDLKMLEISEAEAAALKDQSQMAGTESLTRIMEVLAEAEMRLRDAASKKILVEVALLKAVEARTAVSIDALLKQLQNLREGKTGEAAPVPAPAAAPSPRPVRAAASAPPQAAPATRPRDGSRRRTRAARCRACSRAAGRPRRPVGQARGSRRPRQSFHPHVSARSASRLLPEECLYDRLRPRIRGSPEPGG